MRFLKTIEVAEVLRVSDETVRAMLRRGDLEGFRSGRSIRIKQESVERLVGQEFNSPMAASHGGPQGHSGRREAS